jgi:hypothetical protein
MSKTAAMAKTAATAEPATKSASFKTPTERRHRKRRRWYESAAYSGRIEGIAAGRGAQHAAGARIGVQPFDPAIGRHPFEMVVHRAVRLGHRTVRIIELTGIRAAHIGQDSVQRLHAGRAENLRRGRCGQPGGQNSYQKKKGRAHRRFLAFFE